MIDDPQLDKLCDDIYRKHRRALDLIFERTSRPYQMLARAVHAWIAENADRVRPNQSQKAYISFVPKAWLPFSHVVGHEGSKDRYSLSVLVKNGNKGARITIELYQGDETYRRSVRSAAQSDAKSFPGFVKNAGSAFSTLFSVPLVALEEDEPNSFDDIQSKVTKALDLYMEHRLPAQTQAFLQGLAVHDGQ